MPIFGISAAILGAIGSFATFLASGTALAGIVSQGLGLAASLALGAIMGPQSLSQAVQLQTSYGTNLHRQVVLGTVGNAGHHTYRNAGGKNNREILDVRVVSNFQIQGIGRVRKGGKWVTPGPINEDGYYKVGPKRTTFKVYVGTLDQTADAGLIAASNPPGRWTVNHRGAGQAYVIVRSMLHHEDLTSPWDAFFEVIGPKLYDWRYDTTVGGDGPNRFNDPATWTGRHDNPVLQMYLLERGVWQNGNLIVGKAVNASRLPLDKWTIAANICDEIVNGKPRYSSHLIAKAGPGVTHKSNMEPLWRACAASWYEGAEGEYPIINTVQAIAVTITDADLMPDEPFRFSKYRSRSELVNTAAGSFINPENFYDTGPLEGRSLAWALAEDGEILGTSMEFGAVTDSEQADRLVDIQLNANRYQANGEICVHPKFLQVKVGQWIAWNSEQHGTHTFQVLGRRLGPPGATGYRNVYWKIQEVGAPIFDPGTTVTVVPTPVVQGDPVYQSELDGFEVNQVIVANGDGVQRAGFQVGWNPAEDSTVTHVAIKYWPTNQPEAVFLHPPVPVGELTTTIVASVVQRTQYALQYWLVSDPPRTPVVTAPVLRVSPSLDKEFYPIKISDMDDAAKSMSRRAEERVRQFQDQIHELTTGATESVLTGYENHQIIRRELVSKTGELSANFLEQIEAATGPNSALALQIEAVNAKFNDYTTVDAFSVLSASVNTQGDAITANSEALTALAGTVNGVSANATFRMGTDYTAPAGWTVRIGMEGRVSAGSAWRSAGLYIDVTATLGRVVLSGDQVAILAGGELAALFQTGTTYIASARIRDLNADNITVTGRFDAAQILQNGTIISDLFSIDAISSFVPIQYTDTKTRSGGSYDEGAWTHHGTVIVSKPANKPCLEFIKLEAFAALSGTGTRDAYIRMMRNGNATDSASGELVASARTQTNGTVRSAATQHRNEPGETTIRYDIWTWNSCSAAGSSSVTIRTTCDCGVWVFR